MPQRTLQSASEETSDATADGTPCAWVGSKARRPTISSPTKRATAVARGASRLSIDGLKYLIATLHQPDVLVQAYCTAYPPEPSWIELVRFLVLRGHRDLAESVVRIAQGTLRSRPGSAVESLRLAFDGWSLKRRAALEQSSGCGP